MRQCEGLFFFDSVPGTVDRLQRRGPAEECPEAAVVVEARHERIVRSVDDRSRAFDALQSVAQQRVVQVGLPPVPRDCLLCDGEAQDRCADPRVAKAAEEGELIVISSIFETPETSLPWASTHS